MAADMHCHTKFSDGSTDLENVITIAKLSNITSFAVTDHDTFAGAFKAVAMGKKAGIDIIPGIEFSAFDYKRGKKVHILGYMPDHPEKLSELIDDINKKRTIAGKLMVERVAKEFPITPEIVARCGEGSTSIFKQHIMHALMLAGYANKFFGELYTHLFNEKDGTAYAYVEYPDVFTVLQALHSAGALAVLAHPSVYGSMELLDELIEKGIDGVEIWHPRNKPKDIEKLIGIADDAKILSLGGTDFHGMYTKVSHPLGTKMTPDENMIAFYNRKAQLSNKII